MKNRYGDAVTSGRKTIKLAKGELHADADLVVTLSYKEGIALYLPDEKRWVVSFPQQHHQQGLKKEEATGRRFNRTVRMFKAARNRLVENGVLILALPGALAAAVLDPLCDCGVAVAAPVLIALAVICGLTGGDLWFYRDRGQLWSGRHYHTNAMDLVLIRPFRAHRLSHPH